MNAEALLAAIWILAWSLGMAIYGTVARSRTAWRACWLLGLVGGFFLGLAVIL